MTKMMQQITGNSGEESMSLTAQIEDTPNSKELSIVEPGKDLKEFRDDMIPDELLRTLAQPDYREENKEQLAPIKNLKTPDRLRMAIQRGPPASVWSHKGRRNLFKHLTDNPRSMGKGVGTRDISFLYDVASHRKPKPPPASKHDKSAVRLEGAHQVGDVARGQQFVPETIIPDEYHIVKSKAVLGLEYVDEPFATKLEDDEDLLRVFPSLHPNRRFEAIQLLKTMDSMLEKTGVNNPLVEIQGPTQIHNLLQLIKKEQNIYDVVFAEVIRQVSVECLERGQLLSKLRQKYADLLNRVPRQLKSLHAEVMAQRSLDRRLTEELLHFKSSIGVLTRELHNVRAHDDKVSQDASVAEAQLAQALNESQTNANLVEEYHELYEMQRRRLEEHVQSVTDEKNMWSNAAYTLALKIMSANNLSTVKRLHVNEKAWAQLANHFSVMLSDKDNENLSDIQKYVSQWKDLMFHFNQNLETADQETTGLLSNIKDGLLKWSSAFEDFQKNSSVDNEGRVQIPPMETLEKLCEEVKKWDEAISDVSERFGGASLLSAQEQLKQMAEKNEKWNELAYGLYRRHKTKDGEASPLAKVLTNLNEKLHKLGKQLDVRTTGENGVARTMIYLQNNLSNWVNRMMMMAQRNESFSESDWVQHHAKLAEFAGNIDEAIRWVGSHQSDEERQGNVPHTRIDVDSAMTEVQDWLKMTLGHIQTEDGKLMAQAGSIHTNLTNWLIEALMHVAPNHASVTSKTPSTTTMTTVSSKNTLLEKGRAVADHLTRFTDYISKCAGNIVMDTMQQKKDSGDEDADHEYRDFMRMKREALDWIRTCQNLVNTVSPEAGNILSPELMKMLDMPEDEGKYSVLSSAPGSRRPTNVGLEAAADNQTAVSSEEKAPEVGTQEAETAETVGAETDAETKKKAAAAAGQAKQSAATTSAASKTTPAKAKTTSTVTAATSAVSVNVEVPIIVTTTEPDSTSKDAQGADAAAEESGEQEALGVARPEESEAGPSSEQEGRESKQARESVSSLLDLPDRMEVIGADDNVDMAPIVDSSALPLVVGSGTELTPPTTALTRSAFDAIAKMDEVQTQLLATEKRAQEAEEKVFDLEDQLNTALEKIRAYDRQMAAMASQKEESVSPNNTTDVDKEKSTDQDKPPDSKKTTTPETPSKKPRAGTAQKKKGAKKK